MAAELANVFIECFNRRELRAFVRAGPDGEAIDAELPGPEAPLAALAEQAAEALARRGSIDAALFKRLIQQRPQRREQIVLVGEAVLGAMTEELAALKQWAAGQPKRRVLVVDDERIIREVCAEMLNEAGFEAYSADSGAGALDALRERPFDVVVTDYRMPVMDGAELIRQGQTDYPHVRFAVISGHARSFNHAVSQSIPYLEKPFSGRELLDLLQHTLAQGAAPTTTPMTAPVPAPFAAGATPVPEVRWHPLCGVPTAAREPLAHEIAAKAASHKLLFRAPDPYVEVMVGAGIAFVEWAPPTITVRRLVPLPTTERAERWLTMFQDYTRVYRLPYRRELEPGGDEVRLEKGLAQARRLLVQLADDLEDHVQRYPTAPAATACVRVVRSSIHRVQRDAESLETVELGIRVEAVLCGVHTALDALA